MNILVNIAPMKMALVESLKAGTVFYAVRGIEETPKLYMKADGFTSSVPRGINLSTGKVHEFSKDCCVIPCPNATMST